MVDYLLSTSRYTLPTPEQSQVVISKMRSSSRLAHGASGPFKVSLASERLLASGSILPRGKVVIRVVIRRLGRLTLGILGRLEFGIFIRYIMQIIELLKGVSRWTLRSWRTFRGKVTELRQ